MHEALSRDEAEITPMTGNVKILRQITCNSEISDGRVGDATSHRRLLRIKCGPKNTRVLASGSHEAFELVEVKV